METKIYRVSLGMNCYLIKEEGLILFDAGISNQRENFLEQLKSLSIEPKDISLIVLSHGHWDHVGLASEIKKLAGCKVAVNQHEKDCVEQGIKLPPPPIKGLWSKIVITMLKMQNPPSVMDFATTPVDLVLEDKEYSLESYGIRGKVIYTPGHSPGSMSLLLDTGEAFVGDLATGGFPQRLGPGLSIFSDDVDASKESCRRLLTSGAKWIYPGHGRRFRADLLKKSL